MARILIVDDSSFMRERCQKLLEQEGHTVFQASDGEEAISSYSEIKPDLIFMDITMPNISGIEAVERILEQDKSAKIIMLSAMGQKAVVAEAIKKGAKYFIVKPFNSEKVVEAIQRYTET